MIPDLMHVEARQDSETRDDEPILGMRLADLDMQRRWRVQHLAKLGVLDKENADDDDGRASGETSRMPLWEALVFSEIRFAKLRRNRSGMQ
jgi:hypothetical protein